MCGNGKPAAVRLARGERLTHENMHITEYGGVGKRDPCQGERIRGVDHSVC